ncbi:MAG TPA: hypothetical protein VE988_22970 [Gemmataceae bacterium]|nr:hypothetical protein [Gemmataceae bacterium]
MATEWRAPKLIDLGGKEITLRNNAPLDLRSLQFTPDCKNLLGVQWHSVQNWEIATGRELTSFDVLANSPGQINGWFECFAVSPDGKVLAHGESDGTGRCDVSLRDATSGKEMGKINVDRDVQWTRLRFSHDGKTLAIFNGFDFEPKIELFDVAAAKNRTKPKAVLVVDGKLRSDGLQSVVFSPDGKTLLAYCGGRNGPTTVPVFDTTSAKQIGTLALPVTHGGGEFPERAVFSPDGRCVAVDLYDGTVAIIEMAAAKPRRIFGNNPPPPKGFVPPSDVYTSFAFSPDGHLFVQAGADNTVRIWDILTGKELAVFKGHTQPVYTLAYAPDGKTIATVSQDGTGLIWDASKIKRLAWPAKALQAGDLEKAWQTLIEMDAVNAFSAIGDLAAAPKDAAVWIKERVKPAVVVEQKRIDELIGQLDDKQFKVREKANIELLKISERIVPSLDKALTANPTLEVKMRLEDLRGKMTGMVLQGERLRNVRAIEVLERIGTPEARQVLEALAAGAPGALVTTSAQAALHR